MEILDLLKGYQTLYAAAIGTCVAIWFNWSKIRLDHDVFKRELFLKYNERYDHLDEKLEKLVYHEFEIDRSNQVEGGDSLDAVWEENFEGEPTLRSEIFSAAFDYINLCSEEYYWYKKGFIEEDVWRCWRSGMQSWHRDSFFMRKIVAQEQGKKAPYYNEDFLNLFES